MTTVLLEIKNISSQSLIVMFADSDMIFLTERISISKPKKEWKFKCKSWIKKTYQLQLFPKYNKTQVSSLLNVSYFFLFFQCVNKYYANQLDIFYIHMNKKDYFYSPENISYGIPLLGPISNIVHPSLSKDMKGTMLLCLKINCINLRTK